MEQNSEKNHTCPIGHCCECNGCGNQCMHGGMRKYWRRHFIVLVVGIVLAFWVGMKLGELKGWMMSSYGMMPVRHGWMMRGGYNTINPAGDTLPVGAPQPTGPEAAVQ